MRLLLRRCLDLLFTTKEKGRNTPDLSTREESQNGSELSQSDLRGGFGPQRSDMYGPVESRLCPTPPASTTEADDAALCSIETERVTHRCRFWYRWKPKPTHFERSRAPSPEDLSFQSQERAEWTDFENRLRVIASVRVQAL